MLDSAKAESQKAAEMMEKYEKRKKDALDSLEQVMQRAAENAEKLDWQRRTPHYNFTSNLTNDRGKPDADDAETLSGKTDTGEPGVGHPWPPMSAILNDGLGGIWVKQAFVDWTGAGLIRNGSTNRVTSLADCKTQCIALEECRLFKYIRNTHECWLDSDVAQTASACALVEGRRNCISYVKKAQKWDKNYQWGVTGTQDKFWTVADQENWLGAGKPANGGRLVRNGRRNKVDNLSACITQCAQLKYCRSMVYFRPNGECWLSSQVAGTATKCARRMGRRDCISYIKKPTNPERGSLPAAKVAGNGKSKTISVENLGDTQQSTISINVPT